MSEEAKASFILLHQVSYHSHAYINNLEIEYAGKPTIDTFREAAQPSILSTLPDASIDEIKLELYAVSHL